jgi:putative membrane protein
MHNYEVHYGGMHLIWWFIWMVLIIWIFATPWSIPGQRAKKDSPLDILKKRFAKGEISKEEYKESEKLLKSEN